MKPKISVIIPCWNVAKYLPKCIRSLEQQTIGIENMELIFVDDASTDQGKTWNMITAFEARYPEYVVAVHLEENLCQGGARNVGLRYAKADYIGFVDSDDWIEPDMYDILYRKIKEQKCDVVCAQMFWNFTDGSVRTEANKEEQLCEYKKSVMEGNDSLFPDLGGGVYTKLYKRELILTNEIWFPEHLKYEDNYWMHVLSLYVRKVCWIGKRVYHYRENQESTTRKKNSWQHMDRLKIELLLLKKYKELGVYDRFPNELEADFLLRFYTNTLWAMWNRFDDASYEVFCQMVEIIRRLCPEYQNNPVLDREPYLLTKKLLVLMEMNLTHEEFSEISKIMKNVQ